MKRYGFTLAEVLITLGIIGVVSAITIPTLISNYNRHSVENKLKSNVALFQNALRMAESKHGQLNEWLRCDLSKENEDNYQGNCSRYIFDEYLAPELKVLKICNYDNLSECWSAPMALNLNKQNTLTRPQTKAIGAVLSNGTSLYMWVGNVSSANYDPQIQLWFDIDGKDKGKNRMGGDVFGIIARSSDNKGFIVYDSSVAYADEDLKKRSCTKDNADRYGGLDCGIVIQRNGWKIPKDYPIRF